MSKSETIFIREMVFCHSALWAANVMASAPAAVLGNKERGHLLEMEETVFMDLPYQPALPTFGLLSHDKEIDFFLILATIILGFSVGCL